MRLGHVFAGETEVSRQILIGRGGPEPIHRDRPPRTPRVALPAERTGRLDREAAIQGGGEDGLAIGRGLALEQLPRRQADHPRRDPASRQQPVGRRARPRPPIRWRGARRRRAGWCRGRRSRRVRHPPGRRPRRPAAAASFWRVSASAVGPSVRSIAIRHASTVSWASAGRSTTRPGMARRDASWLDRLVRRAVLAEEDRVVGEHVDDRLPHQGGESNRRPHVVREDEEGAAEGTQAAGDREAVQRGAHAVLAHAEAQVAPGTVLAREVLLAFGAGSCSTASDRPSRRPVRAASAPGPRAPCRRRRASPSPCRVVGLEARQRFRQPSGSRRATALQFRRRLGFGAGEGGAALLPRGARLGAAPRRSARRPGAPLREPGTWARAASRDSPWWLAPRLSRAARRGPRRCPACAGCRSRSWCARR